MMEPRPDSTAGKEGQQTFESDSTREPSSELSTSDSQCSSAEEREHLQVYLRVRPFTAAESSNGESLDSVIIEPPDTVTLKPPSLSLVTSTDKSLLHAGQRFKFSRVFGPETTQGELFEGTVKEMVKDVVEGGDSLVFTYGVTNAGKTFTFLGPDNDPGILPRSLDVIFSSIGDQGFPGMSIKPHFCREFTKLTAEQQSEEALFKRNLFRQLKEVETRNASIFNSTVKTVLEDSSVTEPAADDKISLEVKFSIWVSFCEIYNENIHDLLEVVPSGASRRTVLRLSQDNKGNAFIKDLRWVQVNSAEEAYTVLTLGKKNQSFSSTRLNQLSSRSHSIFSIRILRIEDVGTPRVLTVSELSLCDLAGSERCAKTQNKGERLKEAGNINTSLLILGKCINALRHNQQAKMLQHVPFRESKLTHYLQGFFCGRGKACMIVNINQCASMYDETLSVLKFSAVAQKLVVLSNRPLSIIPQRSSNELSFVKAVKRKALSESNVKGSLTGSNSNLEDVEEDDEYEEGKSLSETTMDLTSNDVESDENEEKILISKRMHLRQVELFHQVQLQLKKERAENILLEVRLREEISREFTTLFSEMQGDFNERLVREREIMEERAERRLEIFKNLINNMAGHGADAHTMNSSPDSSAELAGVKKAVDECLRLCRAEADGGRGDVAEELERKVLEISEHLQKVQQQMVEKDNDVKGVMEDEEKRKLHFELQEKSAEVGRVQKQFGDMQRAIEDALAALEYQTQGKEEVLASLEEERKARKEALSVLEELKRNKEEVIKSLSITLEAERSAKLHAITALNEVKQRREEDLVAFAKEKSVKEEIQSALETKRKEISRLLEEGDQRQQEVCKLQEVVAELTGKIDKELQAQMMERSMNIPEKSFENHEVQPTEEGKSIEPSEDLKRVNSDLPAEAVSLGVKVSEIEASSEQGRTQKENCRQMEEKLAQLQVLLHEKEAHVISLQKSLQDVQERQQEVESHTIKETRQREVERRRELLAVAHEAIAQKDEELQKKTDEISRLKENAKQESEKAEGLSLEVQRKEDDVSDLREKLADCKKQIQQVQKEISSMREEEKVLRQKLSDVEKAKKQLQCDLASRERMIQHLRAEQSSDTRSEQTHQLYQKACKDLEAKERVMEDMRLTLTEQEETQKQMEEVLEDKLHLIQELSDEVEKLKGMLLQQSSVINTDHQAQSPTCDLEVVRQEASQAQENLKLCRETHQADRKKWLEEKLLLIGQAKEAEDKRNQEMRKFVEDRERYNRQQSQLKSLLSQLSEKEQTMERWKKEKNTLVSAFEMQLQKIRSSEAEKDKLIQQLQQPPEGGGSSGGVTELQATLHEREAQILQLKEELKAARANQDNVVEQQDKNDKSPATLVGPPQIETISTKSRGQRNTRASVSSQGSVCCPSVLDSSEISTENGRTSRFPRPELEISFSPLQPNRMALRRQGEENAVTVKISHMSRKRKSGEMDKDEVEVQNRRNTRNKLTPKLTPHKEEISSPARRHDSRSSIRRRREGTLQKIGEFLQSSPTLLGTKAKKMMSLVSGHRDADSTASTSSLSLRARKSRRKLYRPEISSPMDVPPHPIISREPEEKDNDHLSIKRRLRSRMEK